MRIHKSIAISAVTILLVTGCSVHEESPLWEIGDADPFAIYNEDAVSRVEFARMRIRGECMMAAGYPEAATWIPAKPVNAQTMRIGYGDPLFRSVEAARSQGFGIDEPGSSEVALVSHAEHDAKKLAQKDLDDEKCMLQAEAAGNDNSSGAYERYVELAQTMTGELMQVSDSIAKDPLDRAVQCLIDRDFLVTRSDNGVAGFIPATTFGKLENVAEEPHTIVRDGLKYRSAVKPNRYIPTSGESEIAVALVECGKSTGATDDFLRSIRREQQKSVFKYEKELLELGPLVEQLAGSIETVNGS